VKSIQGGVLRRVFGFDPELAAHVRKLADARRKAAWLSKAAEGLRDISQLPAAEAAVPDFESIAQRADRPVFVDLETTSW
jgi:2-methylisocitrate lyase-like PEP mutase family enzyme